MSSQSLDIVISGRSDAARQALAQAGAAAGAAAAEIKKVGATATAALKREVGDATLSAGTALRQLTGQVQGVGPALKGVQQAGSAAMQALSALGEKASPQIAAITNAVTGLAAGGFTPLGIAIGVATTAIGLFGSSMEEKLSPKAQAARDRIADLRKEIAGLDERLAASRLGLTLDRYRSVKERGDLLGEAQRISAQDLDLRERRAGAMAVAADSSLSSEERGRARSEVAELTRQIKVGERAALDLQVRMDLVAEAASKAAAAMKESSSQTQQSAESSVLAVRRVMQAQAQMFGLDRAEVLLPGAAAEGWSPDADSMNPVTSADRLRLRFQQIETDARERQVRMQREARAFLSRQWDPDNMPVAPEDTLLPPDAVEQDQAAWRERAKLVAAMNVHLEHTVTLQEQLGTRLAEGIGDSVTESFVSWSRGAESFGQAFGRMAEGVVSDLQRIAIRQLVVNQLVSGLSSAFGGSAVKMSAADQADMGYWSGQHAAQYGGQHADGGSYTVRGSGGPDSQLVLFRATPGERVDFTPPGKAAAGDGGGVQVVIENHSGQPARTERSRTPDGRTQIRAIIGEAVAADVAEGGPVAKAIERGYGLRRSPRRGGG